ncbi:MAG TPA: hypothetical protein VGQ64_02770 [Candidatus Limnocylindrales bacterium]|jgi:hypothetical protein|nr:hypothetical protein [Candidatus Limnocylindrales bacterium]
MASEGLGAARATEDQHRTIVARLRAAAYAADAKAADIEALHAAEIDLARAEGERAKLETAEGEGVIAGEKLGHLFSAPGGNNVLVPSITLAMAQVPIAICHLLRRDETPLLRISLENRGASTRRVRVTSFIEGYSARAVDTFDVPTTGSKGAQLPTLFPEHVQQVDELTRATVNVLVEALDGTGIELHRTEPVWLLARTSVPYAVKDPSTGGWADFTKYFGAFVTPNAPAVMAFLPTIAAKHPKGQLVGYQEGPADVRAQVEATFAALKGHGVQYVNSTTAFGPDDGEVIQRVRLPAQTLALKGGTGANCIDGTVLFASLLEAMTLNAAIVTLPGHAIVAWETEKGADTWDYVDTVLIHNAEFGDANQRGRAHATPVEKLFAIPTSKYNRWSIRGLRAMGITPTY